MNLNCGTTLVGICVQVTSTTLGWKPNSLTGKENCTNDRSRHITDGIAEGALQKGLAVGFVTNTRVTHATPASLYAKGVHRNIENDRNAKAMRADCPDIARQLLSYPASEFKVLMGGGVENLLNTSRGGERRDGRNIDIEWSRLGGRRRVLRNENDLLAVTPSDEKLLGIFAKSHLPMYIQEQVMGTKKVPRLMEMTAKAIEQLQHGEQGFFLMVEGGIIDIAEHQNLINVAFAELYEFDEAIRKAREITDPTETLIIVTADHDHAFTLPGYLPVEERIIGNSITEHKNGDGAGLYEVPGVLFVGGPGFDGDALKIDKNVAQRPKIAGPFYRPPTPVPMPNGPHGGVDVGIWADGPYSELFSSTIENTEVAYIIKFLLCTNNTDYTICDASGSSHHFTKRIVDRVGPNAIVLIGALLIAMTILSILVAVVVIVLLVMQRRSHSRNLDLNDESFGSGSKSPV
ncbi:hypothetical protein Y032_0199g1661 [Ancylostoma ceylanicum]|uniref:alkaline phosphatase n=1 Tax=Ancylostoma ceylanicum TaxID=53326 RepID=A0A016SN18_9BILA|nr:hypothetical protein Y032_0199g1661 [Ancylostoma ceylanicum]